MNPVSLCCIINQKFGLVLVIKSLSEHIGYKFARALPIKHVQIVALWAAVRAMCLDRRLPLCVLCVRTKTYIITV